MNCSKPSMKSEYFGSKTGIYNNRDNIQVFKMEKLTKGQSVTSVLCESFLAKFKNVLRAKRF